jgi:predicted hotdog family 3-hydroxylacyl-ACP dehydratase
MSAIGREMIEAMIPHAGAMCLLDAVLRWDAGSIHCVSFRFGAGENPMRRADGTLGAACLIELAAQAMAVHGRLTAGADGAPVRGYLASLRDVRLAALVGAGELVIEVELLMGDVGGASYRFTVSGEGVELASGRATVLFEGAA